MDQACYCCCRHLLQRLPGPPAQCRRAERRCIRSSVSVVPVLHRSAAGHHRASSCVQYRFNAVLYFYVTWFSRNDTATWFKNNIGRNCADTARADYVTNCQDLKALCTTFRTFTKDSNASVIAEADRILSKEAGIPVAATCESFTGRLMSNLIVWDSAFVHVTEVAAQD